MVGFWLYYTWIWNVESFNVIFLFEDQNIGMELLHINISKCIKFLFSIWLTIVRKLSFFCQYSIITVFALKALWWGEGFIVLLPNCWTWQFTIGIRHVLNLFKCLIKQATFMPWKSLISLFFHRIFCYNGCHFLLINALYYFSHFFICNILILHFFLL